MRLSLLRIPALFALLLAAAVWVMRGRSPDDGEAIALIQSSASFAAPRYADVPRYVSANPGYLTSELSGTEAYGTRELAVVYPVLAVLSSQGLVRLTDYRTRLVERNTVGDIEEPYAETIGPSAPRVHTLRIEPLPSLTEIPGFDDYPGAVQKYRHAKMQMTVTPGWRVPIARRQFVAIGKRWRIPEWSRSGVTFCWRWSATPDGVPFDVGTTAFADIVDDESWGPDVLRHPRGANVFFDDALRVGEATFERKGGRWALVGDIQWPELRPGEVGCR